MNVVSIKVHTKDHEDPLSSRSFICEELTPIICTRHTPNFLLVVGDVLEQNFFCIPPDLDSLVDNNFPVKSHCCRDIWLFCFSV